MTITYELLITLHEIEPPIWRRVRVAGSVTLHELHLVIQAAMGWKNSHLYEFQTNAPSQRHPGRMLRVPVAHARNTSLQEFAPEAGFMFYYVYDPGDGWEHTLVVEKISEGTSSFVHPVCLGGARACPPEDCGGVPGYQELVEAMANPTHERRAELLEWLGAPFDPEAFSEYDATTALRHRRVGPRR